VRESWGKPDPKPGKGERKGEKKTSRIRDSAAVYRKTSRERECRVCGDTYRLESHHLVPRARGEGDDVEENTVPLCEPHHAMNHRTGDRRKLGRLLRPKLREDEIAYVKRKKGKAWFELWFPSD
jgi:5-methylcytosine-specific restriction endonuclease McrA